MIAIKFSPKFEDRVGIFLKNTNLKALGITYDFKETPSGEPEYLCYWLFKYHDRKSVNTILRTLIEMKEIMGVDGLEFSYCESEKEFYCQYSDNEGSVPWFIVRP